MGLRDALDRDDEREAAERRRAEAAWSAAVRDLQERIGELVEVLHERGAAPRHYHVAETAEVLEQTSRGLLRRPDESLRVVEHAVYAGQGWTVVPGLETPLPDGADPRGATVVTESTIVLGVDGGVARSVRWPGRGDVLRLTTGFIPVTDPRCPHGFTLDLDQPEPRYEVVVAGDRLSIEAFSVHVVKHVTGQRRWPYW